MIYIGIDPGKDGAIAAIESGAIPQVEITPTVLTGKGSRRSYDEGAMRRLLREIVHNDPEEAFAIIEKQQAMPGQGVVSMFSIGEGFGLWKGYCSGMGIRYQVVHPRTWKKEMLRDVPGSGADKGRSIIAAGRMFPDTDLRRSERARVSHDGKAEALLIAMYGKRIDLGEA